MMISKTDLSLNKVKFFVMDEADRLLDREDGDFTDDIGEIMAKLPPREKRQTLMYSATLSETIEEARSMATTEPFFWQRKEFIFFNCVKIIILYLCSKSQFFIKQFSQRQNMNLLLK